MPIIIDKGYLRHRRADSRTWEYWRVAVGAHHPTRYLGQKHPPDRLRAFEVEFKPWRRRGLQIVIAGSSAKYHAFYGLEDPTTYATKLVAKLRRYTDRPIIYRPKPSWRDAVPIKGTMWSGKEEKISDALYGAWALVTHGSNACFEAAMLGVPSIILGDGVAKPISSTAIGEINAPHLASDDIRRQWLANLAYCQWTLEEFASGDAWATIRGQA